MTIVSSGQVYASNIPGEVQITISQPEEELIPAITIAFHFSESDADKFEFNIFGVYQLDAINEALNGDNIRYRVEIGSSEEWLEFRSGRDNTYYVTLCNRKQLMYTYTIWGSLLLSKEQVKQIRKAVDEKVLRLISSATPTTPTN